MLERVKILNLITGTILAEPKHRVQYTIL